MNEQLYDLRPVPRAAEALGLPSAKPLYVAIKAKKLVAYRLGERELYVDFPSAVEWLESRRTTEAMTT